MSKKRRNLRAIESSSTKQSFPPLKILWHGDAGVHTGFGRVTHAFGERLIKRGMSIDALAVNWRGDPEIETKMTFWMTNYFDKQDVYGLRRLPMLCEKLNPDVVVIYNDLPVAGEALKYVPANVPTLLYFPVDCVNLPQWWLSPLRRASKLVTFSQFGVEQVKKADSYIRDVDLIYHGINTDLFYPITEYNPGAVRLQTGDLVPVRNREEARALLGVADRFIVLWSDRNSVRKNAHAFFQAMAPLIQKHPDILLWIHAKPQDEGGDLNLWVERYGLSRNIRFTAGIDTWIGIEDDQLNALYNAADVRVSTSLGEGFGLHGGECASAGLAQVAPEFTCFREVIGDGALYVSAEYPYTTARGVDLYYPNVGEITDAVELLYNDEKLRARLASAGRAHATSGIFDWDHLTDRFAQALVETASGGPQHVLVGS